MKFEETQVNDGADLIPAKKAVCTVCGGESFHTFVINVQLHLQCANPICNQFYLWELFFPEDSKPVKPSSSPIDSGLDGNGTDAWQW